MTTYQINKYQSPSPLAETMELGDVLAQSGMFTDARQAAQAVVKVLAGQELGFGPIASMTGIHMVKGRITLSANLMAAAIKGHAHYNYRVLTLDDSGCEIAFFENGEEVGHSKFTANDAKNAGLAGGDNYKKYPRNMYFARALSNGARWYCPDIFGGNAVYTPDELGEAEAVVVETPSPNGNATYTGPDATIQLKALRDDLQAQGGTPKPLTLADVQAMSEDDLTAEIEATKVEIEALTSTGDGFDNAPELRGLEPHPIGQGALEPVA